MLPATGAAGGGRAARRQSHGLFDDADPELALPASPRKAPPGTVGDADGPAAPATPPRQLTAADRAAQDRYLEESFGLRATDEALEAQIARLSDYLTAAPSPSRLPALAPDDSGSGGGGAHAGFRRQQSADGESGPFASMPDNASARADSFFSGAPKGGSSTGLFESAVTGGEGNGTLFG